MKITFMENTFMFDFLRNKEIRNLEKKLRAIDINKPKFSYPYEHADETVNVIREYFNEHSVKNTVVLKNDPHFTDIPDCHKLMVAADIAAFANNNFLCTISEIDDSIVITKISDPELMKAISIRYETMITNGCNNFEFRKYIESFVKQAIIKNESSLLKKKEFRIPLTSLSENFDWNDKNNFDILKREFSKYNFYTFVHEGNLHVCCSNLPIDFKIPEKHGS